MMAATLYGMMHMGRKPNSSLSVVAAAGEAWRTVAVNQTASKSNSNSFAILIMKTF